ncbi:protein FAM3C isoform X2 [Hoplias malabaricus]|uniref:protein FAM3C isoform X2 n=1 Tax=Hoplias malabaricus TaxID=27720 RepID=UPI003462DEFA
MKLKGIFFALIVAFTLLLIWGVFINKAFLQKEGEMQGTESPISDCNSLDCPEDHFPFFIRSGLANVIGPKICFNNKIVMGGIMDNVGWGLNIVVVKGETGEILKNEYFNVYSRELSEFLKLIERGSIILLASFENPEVVLTEEIRELFAGLGSKMSHAIKKRDTWVFAGAAGVVKERVFEKLVANDEKSNAYGDWPAMEEVGGCFPRKI